MQESARTVVVVVAELIGSRIEIVIPAINKNARRNIVTSGQETEKNTVASKTGGNCK